MGTHKDLRVYQNSYKLALYIHTITLEFPKYLQYDLADQLRRASRSIPSNIAEGYSRSQSRLDIQHFLRLAIGSNEEVLFNIKFAFDLKLINPEQYQRANEQYTALGKQLKQLIRSLAS